MAADKEEKRTVHGQQGLAGGGGARKLGNGKERRKNREVLLKREAVSGENWRFQGVLTVEKVGCGRARSVRGRFGRDNG